MNSLRNFTPFILTLSLVFGISSCAQEVVDSHEHTFATDWTKNETHHWHVATCEHTSQIKDKTEHSFGEWQIMIRPTEEAGGAKERTCSICSYKAIELMPKLDHVHAKGLHHDFVAGTCITNEIVEHYDCVKETCPVKLDIDGNPLATTEGELNPGNHTDTTTTWITTTTSHKEIYNCCRAIKTAESPHIEDAGAVTTAPTCVTEGIRTFKCSVCNKILRTEEIPELYSSPIDADTGLPATSSSKYIFFGVFPKSVLPINSSVTVDETESVTMGANTYYKGSDGNWYAKVLENISLPVDMEPIYSDKTKGKWSSDNSYRYFKVEPIKWELITNNYNGGSLLLAENILTSNIPYYENNQTRTIDGKTVYATNYKHSQIRAYLNGISYNGEKDDVEMWNNAGFLQTSFTQSAQSLIMNTEVDVDNTFYQEDLECENTIDKVFLLSENELNNPDYGFGFVYGSSTFREEILKFPTDYAKANHCDIERGHTDTNAPACWWTRTPFLAEHTRIVHYDYGGWISSENTLVNFLGIAPALTLSLP